MFFRKRHRIIFLQTSQKTHARGDIPGKDFEMKKGLTKEELKERRRREAIKKKIYEEEGFTEEEIMFMSKKARQALMEKYGLR